MSAPVVINVRRDVLGKNAQWAARLRERFRGLGLTVLNVLSAPGSGKTALLERTLTDLADELRAAVIVGDLATDNDARRLARAGCPVVQLTTGSCCHLDATMIDRACGQLDLEQLDMLVIENVGNLVCPASYDLGESVRVVLMSVTEGEDKPLKYPAMFQRANVVLLTKSDLAGPAGFDAATARDAICKAAPAAVRFEVSARTGEGLAEWYDDLRRRVRDART